MNLFSSSDLTKVARDLAQPLDTETASTSWQVSSILRRVWKRQRWHGPPEQSSTVLLVTPPWVVLTMGSLHSMPKKSAKKYQLSSGLLVKKTLPLYFTLSLYRIWFQIKQIVLLSNLLVLVFYFSKNGTQRTPHRNQLVFWSKLWSWRQHWRLETEAVMDLRNKVP